MKFEYSDQHHAQYVESGFTILRSLIPGALLADLRRETAVARELARKLHGPRAQRLQPVYAHAELNHQPFRDFLELPGLRATVNGILGPTYQPSNIMGVLFEPDRDAWCTHWHRDWGYNAPHVDLEAFFEAATNLKMFNQLNAALYDDHSLWVVPGSHARRDSAEERTAFPIVPPPGPEFNDAMTPVDRELTCQQYVHRMPGGIPVTLFAGDVAFYRACQWHIGNYVPYTRRATLHDGFYGEEDLKWQSTVREWQAAARLKS